MDGTLAIAGGVGFVLASGIIDNLHKKLPIPSSMQAQLRQADTLIDRGQLNDALTIYRRIENTIDKETHSFAYGCLNSMIGEIFIRLAKNSDEIDNYHLAIQSFRVAENIFDNDEHREYYLINQANLIFAGLALSQFREQEDILRDAFNDLQATLQYVSPQMDQTLFVMFHLLLGDVLCSLATHNDREINGTLAIEAYKTALKYFCQNDFPLDYAMTQNNLGAAYITLAEVEDRQNNCLLAVETYNNAMAFFKQNEYPEQYEMVSHNRKIAEQMLAEARK